MFKKAVSIVALSFLFVGCASVQMESPEVSAKAKQFNAPAPGKAGLYIYRSGSFGAGLKKDIWVDGECVGESARNVFFYSEVAGGKEHKVSTESEFSPNDIQLFTDAGKNYFVKQFIKVGVFVGGAGLEAVSEEDGKSAVRELDMAAKGSCSK